MNRRKWTNERGDLGRGEGLAGVGIDGQFVTTRWTMVLQAGRQRSPQSEEALAELCRMYWFPLYAYIRRRGESREDAEDLTQGFFEKFLSRNYLEGLVAERGRFRAFLLASLKHYLSNAWDRERRLKRGGAAEHLSLNWELAEDRLQVDGVAADDPELSFDRAWAHALLERVLDRLRDELLEDGRGPIFTVARTYLTLDQADIPYADGARRLCMEEGALRVQVHRLRRRYREILREEIAQTLCESGDVEGELQALRQALGSR